MIEKMHIDNSANRSQGTLRAPAAERWGMKIPNRRHASHVTANTPRINGNVRQD